MKKAIVIVTLLIAAIGTVFGQDSLINTPGRNYNLSLNYEFGAVKVLQHTLRLGAEGTATDFDYVNQGGQEILFPFERYSADLTLADRHNIVLLYQPLTVVTQTRFKRDVVVDDVTFPAGSEMELKYGFPFWRLSYLFDFVDTESFELAAGVSLQLRNASITFAELNGESLTVNQNLGPVPILKLRTMYRFNNGMFIGAEIDGFYASSALFNGADYAFEGSILDASLRGGVLLKSGIESFLNLRFLGGTAAGTSQDPTTYWTEGNSNSTANNLGTLALTLGFTVR
jgi:hypothetical protein